MLYCNELDVSGDCHKEGQFVDEHDVNTQGDLSMMVQDEWWYLVDGSGDGFARATYRFPF